METFCGKRSRTGKYGTTAEIIRVIALTGCRRTEVIGLRCGEVDIEGSCLRLTDSKEGASVRPIGLPVLEYLEGRRNGEQDAEDYVVPGREDDTPCGAFPRQWTKLLKDTDLAGITPHVLRHSFASIGNDLGFTGAAIAALVEHSRGTVTSRYIHIVDTALIMAADSIAGYIQGLLALDRDSRKSALAHFLGEMRTAPVAAGPAVAHERPTDSFGSIGSLESLPPERAYALRDETASEELTSSRARRSTQANSDRLRGLPETSCGSRASRSRRTRRCGRQ